MADPSVRTDERAFRAAASDAPDGARVPVEIRVPVEDPFDAYRRARGDDHSFFFETTGGSDGWGYFGVRPDAMTTVQPGEADSLATLESLVADERLVRGNCSVPYPGGVFGWLSYDVARELEDLPGSAVDDRGLPRLQFGTYTCIVAWREPFEAGDPLHVIASPRVGTPGADATSPADAYAAGRRRALALAEAATTGDPSVGPPPTEATDVSFESDCGREAYAERVRRVKEYVRDGDTFQTNVSQRMVAPAAVHPVEVYDALREVNPAPYSGLVEFPAADLVSASPELLLDQVGDRLVTEPIAGTRPRGDTPEADERLAADLLDDEKERAEHAMLVDLERNDLGKVSDYGTVDVHDYRRVDRYSEVMHLVSEVRGRLHEDQSLADAIAAVFPGGTITGAPKPRTMEIIDELEATRRGPYTGSMAAIGFDGRATLNIVIRTLIRHDEEYHLRVGAGIVHDSVPDLEYDETLAKARALVNALDEAFDRTTISVAEEP